MLIALFADIHANKEAFSACLADAAQEGASRYVFLGDLVGYGPDPAWVVERVMDLMSKGAVAVQGNHDDAISNEDCDLSAVAKAAIVWTRERLDRSHKAFLEELPLEVAEDDRLYVHANAAAPHDWIYTLGVREAFQSLRATRQRVTFCGHTHVPAVFHDVMGGLPQMHVPISGRAMPLLAQRRWVAVLGAVGQSRDHNPAACYGMLDAATARLTYVRVPYDNEVTARKIGSEGLPHALAKRLLTGE